MLLAFTYRELANLIINGEKMSDKAKKDVISSYCLSKLNSSGFELDMELVNKRILRFFYGLKVRYDKLRLNKTQFKITHGKWLDKTLSFVECKKSKSHEPKGKPGPPRKPFDEASERTKRRFTKPLRSNYSADELRHAAESAFRTSGRYQEANKIKLDDNDNGRLSSEKALAMLITANLTKDQYNIIKSFLGRILPNYNLIREEKGRCIPYPITASDKGAEVLLQDIVNETIHSIMVKNVLINNVVSFKVSSYIEVGNGWKQWFI